jgi:hypothetical protein
MKQFIMPTIQLRQTIAKVLLGIMFLVGTVFYSAVPAAIAKPLTSETRAHQVDQNARENSGYFQLNSTDSSRADDKTQQAGSARPEGKAAIANQQKTSVQSDRSNRSTDENKNYVRSSVRDENDSVREKLNLDQPLYPGTKEFARDVKEKVGNAIDNTKDAFTGIGDDVRDTVEDSFEQVH